MKPDLIGPYLLIPDICISSGIHGVFSIGFLKTPPEKIRKHKIESADGSLSSFFFVTLPVRIVF